MSSETLGFLEEQVLTLVLLLGQEAYGKSIVQEVETRFERKVNLSSVHVTLYRLEDKGLVKSHMGGATNARGGRRKRIFTITNAGIATLQSMKSSREALWKVIPQLRMSW